MQIIRDDKYNVQFRQYHMTVHAALMAESFETKNFDGTIEYGQAGDWLVRSPTGEYYPMHSQTFEELYALL